MQAKHAAPGPFLRAYKRLSWMVDQPLTNTGKILTGGLLGLIMALAVAYCYFN